MLLIGIEYSMRCSFYDMSFTVALKKSYSCPQVIGKKFLNTSISMELYQ